MGLPSARLQSLSVVGEKAEPVASVARAFNPVVAGEIAEATLDQSAAGDPADGLFQFFGRDGASGVFDEDVDLEVCSAEFDEFEELEGECFAFEFHIIFNL